MQLLFVDAESSGLFTIDPATGKWPTADGPNAPRMAQIGLIFVDGNTGDIQSRHEFLIKPRGWVMSPEAEELTGLTTAYLEQHGGPINEPLDLYIRAIESRRVIAGWNLRNFDMKLLRGELRRAGKDDMFMQTRSACLMQASRPVVKARNKLGHIKAPRLDEACAYFDIHQPDGHKALADAMSTYQIWQKLREQGIHPEINDPYNKTPKTKKPAVKRGRKDDGDENDADAEVPDFLGREGDIAS